MHRREKQGDVKKFTEERNILQQAVSKPVLCVQWKTPGDGQRNCPKHVDFHSKIKTFEKLVHPVGFIIRIYHSEMSSQFAAAQCG